MLPATSTCSARSGAAPVAPLHDLASLPPAVAARRGQFAIKRVFDVIAASCALVLLAPLLLVVSTAILLESGSPVFFRQPRVGYRNRKFVIFKFRSMKSETDPAAGAPRRAAALTGVLSKSRDDPRITRVGRILRQTSLDELPQLINVIKGDMSLVGPRPLLAFMLAPHPAEAAARGLVRPGLTGLWQLRDRANNQTAAAMFPHDFEYISRFNLLLDARVLCLTPLAVLSMRGAD